MNALPPDGPTEATTTAAATTTTTETKATETTAVTTTAATETAAATAAAAATSTTTARQPSVVFRPSGVVAPGNPGESLFEIGRRSGVPISTSCNGKASCGLCRVAIVDGEEGLTPLGPLEKRHLGNVYFITKQRLACQARLTEAADTVTIDVP
jgi:ferredoxin